MNNTIEGYDGDENTNCVFNVEKILAQKEKLEFAETIAIEFLDWVRNESYLVSNAFPTSKELFTTFIKQYSQ